MARLVAGSGSSIGFINYPYLDFGDLFVYSQQDNQFVGNFGALGVPAQVATFSGSGFSYPGGQGSLPSSGTITGISESFSGQKIYDLTEISISVEQFLAWAAAGPGGGLQFEGDAALFSGGDYIEGSNARDILFAYEGDDTIRPGGGNDDVDGGGGLDTLQVSGALTQYTVQYTGDRFLLDGPEGSDQLFNVERIQFNDNEMIGLDVNGTGGYAYRLYQAAFDRAPDDAGLGFWIDKLDEGMDLIEVSARFIDSNEFRSLYGTNPSTQEFVTKVYNNVLNRAPDQAGLDFYVNQIDSGQKSAAKVLADFSDSPENQANVNGQIANGFGYDLWVG
jgi:hypothetical protein